MIEAQRVSDQPETSSESQPGVPRGAADGDATNTARVLDAAVGRLTVLRGLARGLLVVHRLAWIIAGVICALVVLALTDYVLRAPGWLRGGGLAVGVGFLGVIVWRRVLPAMRFRPSLADFALRLEQTEQARRLGLGGVLASAVELSGTIGQRGLPEAADERGRVARGLTLAMLADASHKLASMRMLRALNPGPALRGGAVMGLAFCAVIGLAIAQPALTSIGLMRILTPWSEAQWPKRTRIADATTQDVHALGSALALRAALVRSPRPSDQTDASVRYRLLLNDQPGPWMNARLTSQERPIDGRMISEEGEPVIAGGVLMEKLLEPGMLMPPTTTAAATASIADGSLFLEYRFETDDDQSPTRRIALIQPPAVIGATASITPPAYLNGSSDSSAARTIDLGPGNDQRAIVQGVLAGSAVEMTIDLSKPVPPGLAAGDPATQPDAEVLTQILGAELSSMIAQGKARATFERARWRVSLTPTTSLRIPVSPTDSSGIASDRESVYRLSVREDRAPEASVIDPGEDMDALATAKIRVEFEGRDDVALARVAGEAQLTRRPASSGGEHEKVGEPVVLATSIAGPAAADAGPSGGQTWATTLKAQGVLDLVALNAAPGDVVLLTALASDRLRESDASLGGAVRSQVRRVRVVSGEQLVERVWNELSGLRRSAIRTAETQQDAGESLARIAQAPDADARPEAASVSRQQAGVIENIQQMQEQLRRSIERAQAAAGQSQGQEQNQQQNQPQGQQQGQQGTPRDNQPAPMQDEQLQAALDAARALLDQARRDAGEASAALQRAQQAARANPQAGQQQSSEARQARAEASAEQQATQQTLEQLAEALDRGQDSWAQRRALERLAEDQAQLRERTAELDRQTTGRGAEELTPEQRRQAQDLARQQEELAQRANEAVANLQQQAERLSQNDPAMSQALRQAAQEGQRSQVSQQMQQAAQQVRENQQQQAQRSQQRAEQAIQQMLDQVRDAQRTRDATLRRELASLVQTLETLIADQRTQITRLEQARAAQANAGDAAFAGLDAPMIRLNTATLAAVDQAAGSGGTRSIAQSIRGAAQAQTQAISALRAAPVDAESADQGERASLQRLEKALEEARTQAQQAAQRDRARQRAELRQAYQALLVRQEQLRLQTEPLVVAASERAPDRRARSVARQVGDEQEKLRVDASDLLKQNAGLSELSVMVLAHRRLDEATAAAAAQLREAQLGPLLTIRQTGAMRTLQSLIDALDEAQREEEFRTPEGRPQEQGGGGGGGGQQEPPLVPPLAELKVLRRLQGDALTATRDAEALGPNVDAALRRAVVQDATQLQRELATQAQSLMEKVTREQGGAGQPGNQPQGQRQDQPQDQPQGGPGVQP